MRVVKQGVTSLRCEATAYDVASSNLSPRLLQELFHIGADETTTLESEGCTIDNISGLEAKIFQQIIDEKRTPVGWEEVYYKSGGAKGFEGKAVINAWNQGPRPSDIIADGFDALESYSDAFYLNNKPSWSQIWKDIANETASVLGNDAGVELRGGEVRCVCVRESITTPLSISTLLLTPSKLRILQPASLITACGQTTTAMRCSAEHLAMVRSL